MRACGLLMGWFGASTVRSKVPDDKDAVKIKCVALIRLEKVRGFNGIRWVMLYERAD